MPGVDGSAFFISTLTVKSAVAPPSTTVAVIVAVPFPTAVTTPFSSTFATDVSLDVHLICLFDALAGVMSTVSCFVSPTDVSG